MTAKEAREKTIKNKTDENSSEMIRARNNISIAVERGAYSCSMRLLSSEVVKLLESEGYIVENYGDFRDGDYTKISW